MKLKPENVKRLPCSGNVRQERGLADGVVSGPLEEGGCECEGPKRGTSSSLLFNIKTRQRRHMVMFRGVHGDALRLEQKHTMSLSPNHSNLTSELIK